MKNFDGLSGLGPILLLPVVVAACGGSTAPENAATDAAADAADAAPGDSAPGEPGSGPVDGGSDGQVTCKAPLADAVTFDDAPLATWCAEGNGGGGKATRACDGYLRIVIGDGTDCAFEYLFDAVSKKLVAKLHACNVFLVGCVAGPSAITPPSRACAETDGWATMPICSDGGR